MKDRDILEALRSAEQSMGSIRGDPTGRDEYRPKLTLDQLNRLVDIVFYSDLADSATNFDPELQFDKDNNL
jgi:hypothetical protein